MKTTLVLVAASGLLACGAPQRCGDAGSELTTAPWVAIEGVWVTAPSGTADGPVNAAPAAIGRFEENHEFTLLRCYLNEYKGKRSPSPGDPWALYRGSWEIREATVSVEYRLIGEFPRQLRRDEQQLSLRVEGTLDDHHLRFTSGMVLERSSNLSLEELDRFVAGLESVEPKPRNGS